MLKSTSKLATVIDNLEHGGYVRHEWDAENRREIHVNLTEAGTSKIEAVLPNHVGALVEIFSVLYI